MPRSSTPRRPRRKREASRPMMVESHQRLALELRMAVEALAGAPSPATFNLLSKMLAALRNAGMRGEPLDIATDTLNAICDRYERVGKIGLKDEETELLREKASVIESALPMLPLNVFARAVAEVEVYCTAVGA